MARANWQGSINTSAFVGTNPGTDNFRVARHMYPCPLPVPLTLSTHMRRTRTPSTINPNPTAPSPICPFSKRLPMYSPIPQLKESESTNIAYHHRPRDLRCISQRIYHIDKRIHHDEQTEERSTESRKRNPLQPSWQRFAQRPGPAMGIANIAIYISS